MDQIDEPKLLRVSEVAKLFNVSKPTVYRMVNSGRLDGYTICGSVRVPAESVSRYLDSHKITGGENNTPIKIDTSPTPTPPATPATPPQTIPAPVMQDLKSQYISSTQTTPATPPALPPALPPAPPTKATAKKAVLTPRRSTQAQPTAEMILQRKAWKMARTLAVKILPADADAEQWDRTLKFAYEEARKRLQAAARATTPKT